MSYLTWVKATSSISPKPGEVCKAYLHVYAYRTEDMCDRCLDPSPSSSRWSVPAMVGVIEVIVLVTGCEGGAFHPGRVSAYHEEAGACTTPRLRVEDHLPSSTQGGGGFTSLLKRNALLPNNAIRWGGSDDSEQSSSKAIICHPPQSAQRRSWAQARWPSPSLQGPTFLPKSMIT